jgi:hypothetical protein
MNGQDVSRQKEKRREGEGGESEKGVKERYTEGGNEGIKGRKKKRIKKL